MAGRVDPGLHVVGTPIGNLEDVPRRALRILDAVDVVYAEDTRRTGVMLKELGVEAALLSLHEHNEARRTEEILERLEAGGSVALVTDAGTPSVSDPGRRVVAAALEAGRRVTPVPGPSAVTTALSVSGLPADRFVFLGFPPRGGEERARWMDRLASTRMTAVVFEAPGRVPQLLAAWEDRGMGDRVCVLARELTKKFEEIRRATVSRLRASQESGEELRGEVTMVLEGGEPPGWEEREAAVKRTIRDMVGRGRSTRDIVERLRSEFGVPRNEAYEMALEEADGRG